MMIVDILIQPTWHARDGDFDEMLLQDVCEDVPEEVCETVMEKSCRTVQEEVTLLLFIFAFDPLPIVDPM